MQAGFKIQNKGKGEAEIYLYDVIGEGWDGGISAKSFADSMKTIRDSSLIRLHINSPGGSVFDGVAIYNMLKNHKANIEVHIDGLAASIASVIAMSGDTINMAANAFMMIHNPWTWAMGFAEDLRKEADKLDMVAGTLRDTYASRTGGKSDAERIQSWMDEETWFTAEDALNAGLADILTGEIKMAAKFDLHRFNFKNLPENMNKDSLLSMGEDQRVRARLARMTLWSMNHKNASATSRPEA